MAAFLILTWPLYAVAAGTMRGDVDGDGTISINDVTTLIDMLLLSEVDYDPVIDVNDDGSVSINDVTDLIDYLLGYGELPPIIGPEEPQTLEFNVNGVTLTMVRVEGGTFVMGATPEQGNDPSSREKPAHQVTVSSFYIAQTEVTQELWTAVMSDSPSYFYGTQHPVEQVSWNDCQEFINVLNALTGKNFRLPYEAEWEFAARGGNLSQGYKYAGSNYLPDVAWYSYNDSWENRGSGAHGTHDVATRCANELGLYDMSGNVHEWCQDWYSDYSAAAVIDPIGPANGSARVYRGGNWYFDEWFCRVSFRNSMTPTYTSHGIGFRLACPLQNSFK